ncbi:MAG: RnfABCDGE type electron transport complex subunit D [Chloroflexia bacterium]
MTTTNAIAATRETVARSVTRPLRRFFRTPKGVMLLVLAGLLALAAPVAGVGRVAPGLLAAVLGASVLDTAFLRLTRGEWQFPSGAILSALFVALVLDAYEPWYVLLATAVLAINSKYVFASRWSNIFNPAAIALVASSFLFASGQSWWGALPDLPGIFIVVLIAAVVFIADRVNKLPMIVAFGAAYFGLFTLLAFIRDPATVAEIFRSPNTNAELFFAGFMLTDPPTSPARHRDQIIYGIIVGLASVAIFETLGGVYFLPAGLLVGNAWETWRRITASRKRTKPAPKSS